MAFNNVNKEEHQAIERRTKGAFTPDANEALSVNYLHVKSMQEAIDNPAALFARITRCELSVWGRLTRNLR